MQSQIEQFMEAQGEHHIRRRYLRVFELFQEFSGRSILEIIEERRANFHSHGIKTRKLAEKEVRKFCEWLRDVKGIPSKIAYYYSISLKSLLVGLPTGVAVGLLFGIILDAQTGKTDKLT